MNIVSQRNKTFYKIFDKKLMNYILEDVHPNINIIENSV